MFTVRYDHASTCLWISVAGFWTPAMVPALGAALHAKGAEARAACPDFDSIVESLDFPVQAQDVADLLAGVMADTMPLVGGHVAVVVGSQLNKAQAERTLLHPRLRVFRAIDAAERWLADQRSSIPPVDPVSAGAAR